MQGRDHEERIAVLEEKVAVLQSAIVHFNTEVAKDANG